MLVLYSFGETLVRIVQLFTCCITMNDMEHTLNTDKPCFREELVQTPLDSVRVAQNHEAVCGTASCTGREQVERSR